MAERTTITRRQAIKGIPFSLGAAAAPATALAVTPPDLPDWWKRLTDPGEHDEVV